MLDQQTSDLGSIVQAIENGKSVLDSDSLENVALSVAKLFGVDKDEVAVMKFVPKFKSLKFVIPEKLTPVGTIPLTSTTALRQTIKHYASWPNPRTDEQRDRTLNS